MQHALFQRLRLVLRVGAEVDEQIAALLVHIAEEEGLGQQREHRPGVGLIVLERLLLPLEGGRVDDYAGEPSALLGDALRAERLAVLGEQHADLTDGGFDQFFRPQMASGAVGALHREIGVTASMLRRHSLIGQHRGHNLLRRCGLLRHGSRRTDAAQR